MRGRVTGAVTQACSVTGVPLPATIDEPVALLFVERLDGQDEVELDAGALDTVEIEGGGIDLGEVAAETLALSLDPFPRSPDAADALACAVCHAHGGQGLGKLATAGYRMKRGRLV